MRSDEQYQKSIFGDVEMNHFARLWERAGRLRAFGVFVLMISGPWMTSVSAGEERSGDTPERPWKHVTTTDGVKVYERSVPGVAAREAKAIATVNASVCAVLAVITDLEHYKDFMPYTSVSKVTYREGASTHFFTVLALPVVGDRYYTIKLTQHPPEKPGQPHRVTWTLAKEHLGKPKGKGLVAVPFNDGYWELKPVGKDRAQVTYYVWTDPGGSLPKFLANLAQRQSVPQVITAVRDRVRDLREKAAKSEE